MGLWAHSGSTQGNMTANEEQGDEGRESRYMKTIVIDKTEKFHYIVIFLLSSISKHSWVIGVGALIL